MQSYEEYNNMPTSDVLRDGVMRFARRKVFILTNYMERFGLSSSEAYNELNCRKADKTKLTLKEFQDELKNIRKQNNWFRSIIDLRKSPYVTDEEFTQQRNRIFRKLRKLPPIDTYIEGMIYKRSVNYDYLCRKNAVEYVILCQYYCLGFDLKEIVFDHMDGDRDYEAISNLKKTAIKKLYQEYVKEFDAKKGDQHESDENKPNE